MAKVADESAREADAAPSSSQPQLEPSIQQLRGAARAQRGQSREIIQHLAGARGAAPADTDPGAVHAAAARGISGASQALPHLDPIQASFGRHDVSGVEAHVGGAAEEATAAMGATAYATGDAVAFGAEPDLHTAAHEAAHVVQQRAGVQLAGGVGRAGDRYEQHADAVADAVVAGESAEGLLDRYAPTPAGGAATQMSAVQARAVQMDDPPVRQGETHVEHVRKTPGGKADSIRDAGNRAGRRASGGGGGGLSVEGTIHDAQRLIPYIQESTGYLHEAAVHEPHLAPAHKGFAAENEQAIAGLMKEEMRAQVAEGDLTRFNAAAATVKQDWEHLQGMMAEFRAQYPEDAEAATTPETSGQAVTGGASEQEFIQSTHQKGTVIKEGLDRRIDAVVNAGKALRDGDGSPTQLATAGRAVSGAEQGNLVALMNAELGPELHDDSEATAAARQKLSAAQAELSTATHYIESVRSTVGAAIKASGTGMAVLEAAGTARDQVSKLHPDVADALSDDTINTKLAEAVTGLGGVITNAKGIVESHNAANNARKIVVQWGEVTTAQDTIARRVKDFQAQVTAHAQKRQALADAVQALRDFEQEHDLVGPNGRSYSMIARFVAAAELVVASATTAEMMGKDASGAVQTAVNEAEPWQQKTVEVPDPLGGPSAHEPLPGVKERVITWWYCHKARAGKDEWAFEITQKNSRLQISRDFPAEQRKAGGGDVRAKDYTLFVEEDLAGQLLQITTAKEGATRFRDAVLESMGRG